MPNNWKPEYDNSILHKKFKDFVRVPTGEETIKHLKTVAFSDKPVRTIGLTQNGYLDLNDADRENHIDILGSPGEGKSKFLEMMVCEDVDALARGKSQAPVCFIDSSPHGSTMYAVLKHCIKIGYKKVCLIDPSRIKEFVPSINPIDYRAPGEWAGAHVKDILQVLWGSRFQDESRISRFAPMLIRAVHAAGATLPDVENFTVRNNKDIIDHLIYNDALDWRTRQTLIEVYKDSRTWESFQSTCGRFEPFFNSIMKTILGASVGMDFRRLIRDGWVILANLYPEGVFATEHQQLLGTIILNEIIHAKDRMKTNTIPYYIYIDEVGQYATRKLSDILYYKRQSGFRLIIAHQDLEQIKLIESAVEVGTKTKVLFWTANPDDRARFVRMMFGGDIPDREATFATSLTERQNAYIKVGKQPTVKTRIKDFKSADVPQAQVESFIQELFISNPDIYRPTPKVWEEIKNRFANVERSYRPQSRERPRATKADNRPRPQAQRTDDRHTDDEAQTPKPAGENRELPTKPKPPDIPPTFIHKRK